MGYLFSPSMPWAFKSKLLVLHLVILSLWFRVLYYQIANRVIGRLLRVHHGR